MARYLHPLVFLVCLGILLTFWAPEAQGQGTSNAQTVSGQVAPRIGGTIVRGGGGGAGPAVPVLPAVNRQSAYSSKRDFGGVPQRDSGGQGFGLTSTYSGFGASSIPVGGLHELIPAPGHEGLYYLSLFVPETGLVEPFALGVPDHPHGQSAPMLVGFHQYSASNYDIEVNTGLWEECKARGWYMLAPYSRSNLVAEPDVHFSCMTSQINTRASLDWVTDRYPIAGDRIYAVGFSMGGGLATSQATRYLDPREAMFAAVVNHTGNMDIVDTYGSVGLGGQATFQMLFGGSPTTHEFEYRRVSPIELDASHRWVLGGDHMAGNLFYSNLSIWYNLNDPNLHLLQQNMELLNWMQGRSLPVVSNILSRGPTHAWSLLDYTAACNWLDTKSLQLPLAGDLLMDRQARFLFFDLRAEDTAGQFSRVSYDANLGINKLSLTGVENVHFLDVTTAELGLSTGSGQTLALDLEITDAAGDTIRFLGVPSPPLSVLRNGSPTSNWGYSAGNLDLLEPNTGLQSWTVQF